MTTWLERAACAEIGGDLFYPVAGSETHYLDLPRALDICRNHCPVRQECLEAAMQEERGKSWQYRHGVRGGLVREDRLALERGMSA